MTIPTGSICRAIDGDRSGLEEELYGVIEASLSGDPGIDVDFYGPTGVRAAGWEVDPDGFVIDGYRIDPADDGEYDHEIRLRATHDRGLSVGDGDARPREQVDAAVIYKLELRCSPLHYTGDVAVFVIPRE